MNEAIGNALLFKLAIAFVIILSAVFIASFAYTKAYKVKNKIIEEIEKQGEYAEDPSNAYNAAEDEILAWLDGENNRGIGYKKNTNRGRHNDRCKIDYDGKGTLINQTSDYEYCVYLINTCTGDNEGKCGVYYHVITYMYLDLPGLDELPLPVNGETMTFEKINS